MGAAGAVVGRGADGRAVARLEAAAAAVKAVHEGWAEHTEWERGREVGMG